MCSGMLCAALALSGAAALYDWPPADGVLTPQSITLPGVKGEDTLFSCADLEFRMGLSSGTLTEITLTQVPAQGSLTVNGEPVKAYDTLTREQINNMVYTPSEEAVSASITFVPQTEDAATTTVAISFNEQANNPPVIERADFETVKDGPIKGV